MQLAKEKSITSFRAILKSTGFPIHSLILSFLDFDTISDIYRFGQKYKVRQYFFQLATLQYLVLRFANRVDRSLFFVFYQEKQFNNIEKQQFDHISANYALEFEDLPRSFDSILSYLKKHLSQCQDSSQITLSLETLLFEADLPLPKLKKETVAMYCQSTFQLFLSQIKFPNPQQVFLDPALQDLKSFLQMSEQTYFKQFLQIAAGDAENQNKILTVRFCAHEITYKNWEQFLIEGCELHNTIVCIFALMDNLLATYQRLVNYQRDPFMKFVEFCLRYSIYKNVITGMEDYLGFLTDSYNTIFKESFTQYISTPEFRLWLPMMKRWVGTMQGHHVSLQSVYHYIATRQRDANLIKFVQGQMERLPSVYNPVCTELLKNDFLIQLRAQVYDSKQKSIESFFEDNSELYDVVTKDYLEYVLDVSINPFSVHWCGSSAQKFSNAAPFLGFHNSFIKYNESYIDYLTNIVESKCPETLRYTVLKGMIQADINYVNGRLIKPITTRQTLAQFQQKMKQKVESKPQMQIFSEQHLQKIIPKVDFNYQDNLLAYFNGKQSIPQTCEDQYACFYDICSALSTDQILIRAHSKFWNQSQPSETDEEPYYSESEDLNESLKAEEDEKVPQNSSKNTNNE